MPSDLLIYEIFDLPGLVENGILRPLGAQRYQFTREYLHSPTFAHPSKAHINPLRASGIWRASSGSIIKILDLSSPNPMVQRVGQQAFAFQFELGGSAYLGYAGPVRFTAQPDEPPLVDAGPDQTIQAGNIVYLQGSGSDPEGEDVTYAWQQISGPVVVLQNPGQDITAFLAPLVTVSTLLTFQLTVSDGSKTATDTVNVTITPV